MNFDRAQFRAQILEKLRNKSPYECIETLIDMLVEETEQNALIIVQPRDGHICDWTTCWTHEEHLRRFNLEKDKK